MLTLVAFWFGTRMCVIGLTGGIACGKSSLCKEFKDSGFSIVDCDEISHSIMKKDKSLIAEVAKNFPTAIDKESVDYWLEKNLNVKYPEHEFIVLNRGKIDKNDNYDHAHNINEMFSVNKK